MDATETVVTDVSAQESALAVALAQLSNLTVEDIDSKIAIIKKFVEDADEKLKKQIADLKYKHGRHVAMLEAARASLKRQDDYTLS